MKNRALPVFLFCLIIVFQTGLLRAQDSERPKIGVVLSGGGAKGVAHIGVLKAMEKAGIYPDYITGTSMGSIVGGLYAIGYSADQIDSIARAIDWSRLLSNNIPFNQVAYEEKPYYGRYFIEFPFRNGKFNLPRGVIEGQELNLQLSNMTRPVHHIEDFSDFPIPFACLGANVATGYADVFDSGVLPEALRASMAIPTFFTPVEIDSNLYIDGGIVRNFPVQEVIDMGADIVIGVSVSAGLDPLEKMGSMVAILSQAAFFASAHDTDEQVKLVDLMVVPDLQGYSTGSFGNIPEIIELGNNTGEAFYPLFQKLADSLAVYGRMSPPERPVIPATYSFQHIKISGNRFVPDELIQGKLRVEPNKEFSIKELEKRINLLYGTLYFDKIIYTIDPITSTLYIDVVESPRASIRLAVHYDTDNQVGLNVNLTLRNYLFPSSRLIAEVDAAINPRASLSYFKYLGKKQNMAVVLGATYIAADVPGYWDENSNGGTGTNNINSVLRNSVINPFIRLQATNKTNATFGLTLEYLNHRIKPDVLDSLDIDGVTLAFHNLNTRDVAATAFYKLNTMNKPFFPNKGIRLGFSFEYLFDRRLNVEFRSLDLGTLRDDYDLKNHYFISFDLNGAARLNNKLSLLYGAVVRMGNGSDGVEWFPYETFIGGKRPIGWSVMPYQATPAKRFSNLNFSALSLALQWEIINNLYLTPQVDYLESRYPMEWFVPTIHVEPFGAYDRRLGFSAKLSFDSIVGPLEIGIGKDQYIKGVHGFFGFGYYFKER